MKTTKEIYLIHQGWSRGYLSDQISDEDFDNFINKKWFSEEEINEAIRIVKYRQTTMDKKLNLLEEFKIELFGDE